MLFILNFKGFMLFFKSFGSEIAYIPYFANRKFIRKKSPGVLCWNCAEVDLTGKKSGINTWSKIIIISGQPYLMILF